MNWLEVTGILLEGVGVLVAVWGLHSRFRQFAQPGESEFSPAIHATRRAAHRLAGWARANADRLLRRRRHVVVDAGFAVTHAVVLKARGRVGFGALPVARSNKPALAELDRRTRMLLERVSDLRDNFEDERDRVDAERKRIEDDLAQDVARLNGHIRLLATGDVTLQYVGLGMVGVGLILQVIGAAT